TGGTGRRREVLVELDAGEVEDAAQIGLVGEPVVLLPDACRVLLEKDVADAERRQHPAEVRRWRLPVTDAVVEKRLERSRMLTRRPRVARIGAADHCPCGEVPGRGIGYRPSSCEPERQVLVERQDEQSRGPGDATGHRGPRLRVVAGADLPSEAAEEIG